MFPSLPVSSSACERTLCPHTSLAVFPFEIKDSYRQERTVHQYRRRPQCTHQHPPPKFVSTTSSWPHELSNPLSSSCVAITKHSRPTNRPNRWCFSTSVYSLNDRRTMSPQSLLPVNLPHGPKPLRRKQHGSRVLGRNIFPQEQQGRHLCGSEGFYHPNPLISPTHPLMSTARKRDLANKGVTVPRERNCAAPGMRDLQILEPQV